VTRHQEHHEAICGTCILGDCRHNRTDFLLENPPYCVDCNPLHLRGGNFYDAYRCDAAHNPYKAGHGACDGNCHECYYGDEIFIRKALPHELDNY
jgi:hypothetical protein